MTKFSYETWVTEQTKTIANAINRLAMGGIYDEAVYVRSSNGARCGELVVAIVPPEGMLPAVAFGRYGTRVSDVPRSQLWKAVWDACRREPICPTE
jgi:hypothetical protein